MEPSGSRHAFETAKNDRTPRSRMAASRLLAPITAREAGRPLAVSWMLTPPDEPRAGRPDRSPQAAQARYRHLDPRLFDSLAVIVETGERTVAVIEQSGILKGARFFPQPVEGPSRLAVRLLWRGLVRPPGSLACLLRTEVEWQVGVSNVFRKLGVRNRAELASRLTAGSTHIDEA